MTLDAFASSSTDSPFDNSAGADSTVEFERARAESNPSAPSEFLRHLPSSASTAVVADGPSQNGASISPPAPTRPQLGSHGRPLNPRSCITCRRRKVKCDKTHPCANCNRAHIECVFPSPGRAPRKVRKPGDGRDKELMERLRRLEGVVKGMGVDVPPSRAREGESAGQTTANESGSAETNNASSANTVAGNSGQTHSTAESGSSEWVDKSFADKTQFVEDQQAGRFENRFGRLVINEGKSRYINNSFWASLSNEVEDLKGILNQSSDEEEVDPDSMNSSAHMAATHQGWIFGFSSSNVDLLSLHPLPSQIPIYWEAFKDRVDPLVKVLHIPTTNAKILSAAGQLATLTKGFEALLFAIYYGATTSLSPEECLSRFAEEKTVLLSRYRFAVEQSLSRANFLTTEEIIVLQAFVVFLICLRRNNDARVIWTLTGLIVRIAQTMGIHRDGSHFGLKPFEIEMRRRLWWQVCVLDTRASEDHGCDPTIIEQAFDTRLPLNINDVDISPDSTDLPPERVGCTDMSFCLIRFEVANTFRRLNYVPPGPPRACTEYLTSVTLQDKERWITECHQSLEDKYLKHCDMSVPIFWVTATVARLMMSKMWLMVYHPFQRQGGGATLSQKTREKLFITSLENIEYSLLLETEARTMKWGWLFKTYMQWHALAFLLSALCTRTTGDLADRAWVAVEKTRDGRWGNQIAQDTRAGHLWRPLKKLYRKARDARQRGLRAQQLSSAPNEQDRNDSQASNPIFKGHPTSPTSSTTSTPPSTNVPNGQRRSLTAGPSYGQTPTNTYELLSTADPAGGERILDVMDTIEGGTDAIQPRPGQDGVENELGPSFAVNQPSFNANHRPMAGYVGPVDLSDRSMGLPSTDQQQQQQQPLPGNGPVRSDSTSSNGFGGTANDELDMSIADASGDMNWENFDMLVRQFGMDIDNSPNGGGGVATDWGGGNWDVFGSGGGGPVDMNMAGNGGVGNGGVNGAGSNGLGGGLAPGNLRRNPGIGMGDWF